MAVPAGNPNLESIEIGDPLIWLIQLPVSTVS